MFAKPAKTNPIDPFLVQLAVKIICNVIDPSTLAFRVELGDKEDVLHD